MTDQPLRPLPGTSDQWLKEIRLAWKDAAEAKPFGSVAISDAELFHLAPLVCLKFRGRELTGEEADRVRKTALANYVVNTDSDAQVKSLASKPKLAFALCYVASHLVLDLLEEQMAGEILDYCEGHLME